MSDANEEGETLTAGGLADRVQIELVTQPYEWYAADYHQSELKMLSDDDRLPWIRELAVRHV